MTSSTADYAQVTETRRRIWSSGDFSHIDRHNVVIAEALCAAVDPGPGRRVLDIACGAGTAALVAGRRYCKVTGIDFVPELIDRAHKRAGAQGIEAEFMVGDAQELPFPDSSFDVVMSVYGVQFAPDQERAAREILRVCKPGGVIGLAGPIPEGWSGELFAAHGKYMPLPPGLRPPARWGTEEGVHALLGQGCSSMRNEKRTALQYWLSPDHAVEVFTNWFGPTVSALQNLEPVQQHNLVREIEGVFRKYNRATDGTAVVENTYMQTVARMDPS